mgnify:FL=1
MDSGKDTGADRIMAGLDPQQRAAVEHLDGPALIVAGAGAGKTTVLVRRAANLVRHGVDPSRILLLTFTRPSAASILERARAFAPEAAGITGGTFHSVASRLIRENHRVFGLNEGFTVMDPADVDDTLKALIADDPLEHGLTPRSASVAKVLSFARNTQRSVHETMSLPPFRKYADQADYFERISRAYKDYRRRHHILDFDDLLELWARMAEHEAISAMLRERFRYVMVDEHQDSNALQLRIIYGLGGSHPNILAVGDPSQSIYAFRGAAPGTMFDFRRRWPETKVFLIETNYRSTPEIVGAADRVDRSMAERFDRKLAAARPSLGTKPSLVHVRDTDAEAEWIVRRIMELRDQGTPLDKQAVLVRSTRRARHVEAKLSAAGIPYKFSGGIKLHEAAHVKDVVSVLRVAVNPSDEPAWVRFLTMLPRIGNKTARSVSADLVGAGDGERVLARLSELALRRKELALAVAPYRLALAAADAMAALEAVRREMGPLLAERYGEEWEWRQKDVEDVVNLAAGMGSAEEFLRTVTIDVAIDRKSEARRSEMDDEAPLSVCTVHASKGLEWDTVYVPSFISGHMPSPYAEPGDGDEEEKRLFYVAVTRARRDLHLMRPASVTVKGVPTMVSDSWFLQTVRPCIDIVHVRDTPKSGPSLALDTEAVIDAW